MSASLTSPTTTFPARLNSQSTKSQRPCANSSATSTQYPTPPPTDNALPRGKKRKITAPAIDTDLSRPRTSNKKSAATKSPATATPSGKPSTPRGRQATQPSSATYPTRLSSAERNRRHIVSEEKRRKEGELERLRLSRLVPDALELDRSEEQLLETTVDFVWSLLDDRRKLVEALESRGAHVGTNEHEGGIGREIWGDEKLMAELGDLEALKTVAGGGGDDDIAEGTPTDAGPNGESGSSRPKPKRKKSKAKPASNPAPSTASAGAESSERNNTTAAPTTAETPLTNPTIFDTDFLEISSYVPLSFDDEDAEARAAANSLVDFPSYG